MATVSIANTTANISGKTVILAERDFTISGSWSFNRSPSAPFTVQAGSAVVTNLDADKLDGLHGPVGAIVGISDIQTLTNKTLTSPAIATPTITGLTTLTGGQIAFPAAQSASVDPNTLDDYEEGAWTPAWGGSGGQTGQVYVAQSGRYIKVGKTVWVSANLTLSTLGTITGQLRITGLPFTAHSTNRGTLNVSYFNTLGTAVVFIVGSVPATTTYAEILLLTAAGVSVVNGSQTTLAATTDFYISGSYEASA